LFEGNKERTSNLFSDEDAI